MRAADRLGEMIARHKTRIRELARQAMPMIDSVLSGEMSYGDLVILDHGGDPRVLVEADAEALGALARKASRGQRGPEHVRQWQDIARQAVELYGDSPAIAFADLAAEMRSEIRMLQTAREEQHQHVKAREAAYLAVDPDQLARSLPGIALSGGPVLASAIGDAKRFPNAAAFKSFTGLSPRASETGNTDRKGQPMSKAGPRRLRDQLVRSANTARRLDPQLAEIYHRQMVERGAHHTKALCVVAAKLAERAWLVMSRGEPYVVRDSSGNEVTREQAKEIIAEQFNVSEEVRRRKRSRKTKGRPLIKSSLGHEL